jgi:hypothetical protein
MLPARPSLRAIAAEAQQVVRIWLHTTTPVANCGSVSFGATFRERRRKQVGGNCIRRRKGS